MLDTLHRRTNIDAGLISTVMLLGSVRTGNASEDDGPDSIKLTGVVRDFEERSVTRGHTDFEKTPSHGFGLYAGNVGHFLDDHGKPVFTGAGRKVSEQATDEEGRPIAAHMANRQWVQGGDVDPAHRASLDVGKSGDDYEVCLVDASFNGDGTSSWTYRVTELAGAKDLSHWSLKLDAGHQVMPGTTPGYDVGKDGSTGFDGIKWDVTDAFHQGEFTIVLNGHLAGVNDDAGVLGKGGKGHDTGTIFVPSTMPSGSGSPYTWGEMLEEDPGLGDDAATMSYASTGGIESAESFNQWYRDVLGVNLSRPLTLTLNRQDDGTYVFDDTTDPVYSNRGGFFPVDGDLFGNSAGTPDHNYHFTYELHTRFTYDAAGSQFFRFSGDDDVWVFIDGKLAIDLGGVHASTDQYLDLDRFGLVDGESYTLEFFFAERHRTQSNFRIVTNLELASSTLPSFTMIGD